MSSPLQIEIKHKFSTEIVVLLSALIIILASLGIILGDYVNSDKVVTCKLDAKTDVSACLIHIGDIKDKVVPNV